MGIYAIINADSGQRYIGSTTKEIKKRLDQHIAFAKASKEPIKLQALFDSGAKIEFEIVEEIPDGSTLEYIYQRERYFIKYFNSLDNGYNNALPIDSDNSIAFWLERIEQSKAKNRTYKSFERYLQFDLIRYRTPIVRASKRATT